jgi:hypothetical protein
VEQKQLWRISAMCLSAIPDFALLSAELATCLQEAAEGFLSNRGLSNLSISSLHQLTTSLDQVSRELLMFGADIWPAAVMIEACNEKAASLNNEAASH